MKTHTFKLSIISAILLMLAGVEFSCKDKEKPTQEVTGTVVGKYSNGFGSVLVQVDQKYPIGATFEYHDQPCTTLPDSRTFKNMIQVQLSLSEIMNKKISFSYRPFQAGKDDDLFTIGSGIGNALCRIPDVPIYVITDYQILK